MRKLKLFSLLMLLLVSIGHLWADEAEYIITSQALAVTLNGESSTEWTITSGSFSDYDATKGAQTTANSFVITCPETYSNVTSIVVYYSTNKKSTAKISAAVGEQAADQQQVQKSQTNSPLTFSFSDSGDDQEITVSYSKNGNSGSLYIKKIVITYTAGGGTSEPTLSLKQGDDAVTSLNLAATDVENQSITLVPANFSSSISSVTTGLYSNEGCTSAINSGAWVKNIAPNGAKTAVTFDVDDNDDAQRQCWLKITASDGSKEASAVLAITQAKYTAPTGTFSLFSGALTEGDYVITYSNKAMNTTVSSSRLQYNEVLPSNSKITDPDEEIIWHIAPSGEYWTIYSVVEERYAAGTAKNNAGLIEDGTDDRALWSVTASAGTYDFENKARAAGTEPGNKWLRNNGTFGFAAYASGTGGALTLYKKLVSSDVTVTNPTHGTISVKNGNADVTTAIQEGTVLTVSIADVTGWRFSNLRAYKTGDTNTPVSITSGQLNMPDYPITITADETQLFEVGKAISVAGKTGDQGCSFTMDGGSSATVYKASGETVALVATPASGHEFVNWTATSGISFNNANNAEATATITAAGTITANFKEQACTGLAAPTLNGEIAKTYNSATIAWNAVTNAGGYVLNLKKHVGNVAVVTDEIIVAPTVSFEKTGLEANTQYDYSIMAIGDGSAYCDENNPLLEGNFTTNDYPAATLSLVENGGEAYNWGTGLKLNSVIALPEELDGLGCTGKVLVGWSSVAVAETDDEPTSNYWAKGANYTIASTADKLYAVLATINGGDEETYNFASFTTSAQDVTFSDPTNFTVELHKGSGSSNPAWNANASEARIYAKGNLIVKSTSPITKIVFTYNVNANNNNVKPTIEGVAGKTNAGTWNAETKTWTGSDTEVTFSTSGSAGNVGFKKVVVTTGEETISAYTTSCSAALPVLDAPTGLTAGTYYEEQTITLAATNDAAIYYSLDGNDPTVDAQHLYSEPFTLSARGTTTIKAIAVKDGYETSEVATATYTINIPFATVGDLFSYLEENSLTELNDVIVTGVVTEIVTEYSSQHKNVSINIADDFDSNSPQLEGYRTKDATGVTAASVVAVGDKVTLKGNYTYFQSTTHELAADNTIEEYTAKELSSVTVGGTASKTAYSEEDNQFSFAGLTATANYSNTGYSKDVTNEVTWKANEEETYTVTEGGDVNVTATLNDVTSDPKVVAVTFTTKTVASIRLEYASTYTFIGFDLPKPKVYASYVEDIPEEEVTELLTDANYDTKSVYDKDVADNYTITVEYKSKEATYTVTVKAIYNTQETAHSVADAIEIIKKSTYTSTSADPTAMYVHGVVSGVGSINSGKLGYYINDTESTDGQLQVYQGLYFGSESFTSDNILAVGDEVIIEGHMLYFSSTTPELKLSPLVYLLKKALPTISVEDVAELEVGQADLDITELITKQGNGVVSLESGDLEKLTVDGLTLHAVGAGDVTVTANLEATANNGSVNYKANSTTFTVHVIAARTRYTVTFDANGADGGSAPEAIANQLEGATVDLPVCSYSWAKHGFTGWKVINLSTSAEIEVENNQFTMPAANVKIQAQWEEIATTHIVFNVNGNTETVAAVDVPQAVEYSITQVTDGQNGYEFFGWATSQELNDVTETIETIENYTPEVGETSKTLYAVFKRVDEGAPKTDVLTAADLTATGTGYVEFSNVSKTSNAVYAGNSAKGDAGSIQLRSKNSNSGIVTTSTGGILKSVTINVGSGSATIDVYGSNTAYSSASDLYGSSKGTKIDGTSSTKTITPEADYKYVGIRSNSGAIYLSSVEITWQPKTTYYTTAPSAVYAVSYALGGGAWQEDEGCDGANVKAGQTFDICESVPVREHYKFVKWQVAGEDVSGTITINAATAITAIWEAKIESNITYKAGTGTGDDAVVGSNEEGAEIVLPSASDKSLSKEGYDFVGWLYNGELYKAGTSFEMPASAVTFVAQWKKQNITKMTLVTDVAQLVDGSKVVIAQAEVTDNACKTMGGQGSNNRSAVASTVSGNVLSVGEETSEFTLVSLGNNLFAFQASNGNYLYAASSGNNYLREQAAIDGNASWTISIASNGVATIKAQGSNTNNWMRFNSSSTLFSCYGSGQQDIAIYANVTAITDDASISDIGYVEGDVIVVSSGATLTMDAPSAPTSITVKENAVVNVSAATEAGTVIVEKGAKLAIEEGGSVTTDEPLVLYTTLGKGTGTNTNGNAPGSSSEIINAERLNATGDVYLEIELTQDAKASAGWYAFSVPFPVDAMNGVYYGDTKLTNEVGYAIMSHYGDLRAKDEYAWKKFRGIMQPGVFYVITVGNTDYKTLRFKKVADESLVASSSVAVSPFPTQTDNNADGAWNGIGNPNLAISNLETPVPTMQFYDHKTNSFIGRSHSVNLVVGSAFFIQYNATTSVSIPVGINAGNGYLAPQRERQMAEEMIYEVQLTNVATGELEDNVFLTAREDATNEYEIGRDVAKLSMGTAKCAQMWIPAYGTKLCAADFQLVNDKAEYPLTLNAPSAGTYSISMVENDAATIYLTYEGSIIWNLSMSAYELTLEKGTTEGYGLLLQAKMPMTPTGVDEVQSDKVQCTKVVIDDHVYILRGGEMYDVTGKAVK